MLYEVTFSNFFLTVLQICLMRKVYCEAETNFIKGIPSPN